MQDACYRAVCSCNGQTISRCDYAPEPFVAFGSCPGSDGGVASVDGGGTMDASADGAATGETPNPCASCAANEVCVQSFDGMCHLGSVACTSVSDACRNKLSASGVKNCKSIPECEAEFCGSPFRCVYDPPCGTEAAEAALYCYGP